MLKKILIILSLLIVNAYAGEATLEKAQHRLPPVIYSIDIPKTVKPNQTYDFKWTVMGYHDAYNIIINIYDKNGNKIGSKQVASYAETQGEYSWGTIKSTKYSYETEMSLDFTGSQELTIRFFASPPNDHVNTTFLSCLVPGGSGYKAGDTTGRKILIDGVTGNISTEVKLKSVKATPLSGKNYAETNEDINFKVLTSGSNIKVYIHFFDGYNYLSKDKMNGGNGVWTFTRAIKSAGNRKYKVTIEDLNGNVLKSHETYIEVKERIIETGYSYPYSTIEYPSVYISQGNNTGSHTSKGKYAYDFALAVGQSIRAVKSGTILKIKENSTSYGCNSAYANDGNYVVIDHGNNETSLYLHLEKNSVSYTLGQSVNKGDIIGKVGLSGWVCGAHLHFQVQEKCASWWCQSKYIKFN